MTISPCDAIIISMNKRSKITLIIFGILLAVYVYSSVCYTCEMCEMQYHFKFIDFLEEGSMSIDGGDFTPIMNLFVLVTNGLISVATFMVCFIYMAVIFVISLVSMLIFRYFALKNLYPVDPDLYPAAKKLFIAAILISVALGLLLTLLLGFLYVIVFNLIWIFFAWLLFIRPLHEISPGYPLA